MKKLFAVLCSCFVCFLSFGLPTPQDHLKRQNSLDYQLESLAVINEMLEAGDSWIVSSTLGEISIADAKDLVNVSQAFYQTDATLSDGVWWNPHSYSVLLRVGEAKELFELSPGGTLEISPSYSDLDRIVIVAGGARTDLEFQDLLVSDIASKMIKTKGDWNDFLENSDIFQKVKFGSESDVTSDGLPKNVIREVSQYLMFNDNGLSGINIKALKGIFSYDDLEKFLHLLGLSIDYSKMAEGDRADMNCPSAGNCGPKQNWICTSNC